MKRRIRLLWKISIGLALLIILTAVAVGVLVHPRIVREAVAGIELSLEQEAVYLRELAVPVLRGNESVAVFRTRVKLLADRTKTRITVIDKDGVVVADSHEAPDLMENHLSRPEVSDARKYGRGKARRYSYTIQREMMYLALPVSANNSLVGYVRTSIPLDAVDSRISSLRSSLLFGIGFALLLSIPIGWYFTRRVVQPLLRMEQIATRIADGEYGTQVRIRSSDEIGELADALNLMSANLAERMEHISRDRSQLEAMLGSMAEGIIAADREERIVHINAVARTLCRIEDEPASGSRVWEVFRIPEIIEGISQAIKQGRTIAREIAFAGSPRDQLVDLAVAPWRNSAGEVLGAVAVLHDVTRLRTLEIMRQEFVANASHELKSPVSAIRGLAETILDDQSMDIETRNRFTGNILKESLRLTTLVQDLLMLSRLEQQDQIGEKNRLDLCGVVTGAINKYRASADAAEINLSARTPESPVYVVINRFAIETAVSNLLSNAINYTPKGGSVTLRMEVEESEAVIEVIDSGIGIDAEHLNRIFERFYRIDRARSRELGGTGLGLSIVKHTVLNARGEVLVDSKPGEGSTFTVRLPLAG